MNRPPNKLPDPPDWLSQATDESGFPVASVPDPNGVGEVIGTGKPERYTGPEKTVKGVFRDRLDAEEILRRKAVEEMPEYEYNKVAGRMMLKNDPMSDDHNKNTPTFVTKDSGQRHVESTGAVRDTNAGKGRFDLIPAGPLKRLAQLYQRGAEKYGANNWRRGINLPRYLDSALRHINDFQAGDRSEDHLIAAAWNLFGYVWTEEEIAAGRIPKFLEEGQ